MTAIAYTTDLITLSNAQAADLASYSALGGGGAGLAADPDFAIQDVGGTFEGITKQVSSAVKGMTYDQGATVTLGADDHIFQWIYASTPGILDTLANGGMRITIGTGIAAYVEYYVEGSDTYQLGGQRNFAVRYQTGAPSPGRVVGSPGAAPQWFGGVLATIAAAKAINLGLDVVRWGTGYYLTGGTGADPEGNFAGVAVDNDTSTNHYGIFAAVAGGYEWKGRLVLGQNNSQVATACEFLDETGASITIPENVFTNTDFTQLIIDHASTIVTISGVTITALGANDPGRLVANNASTVATLTGWRFIDFGITTLRALIAVPGCTWLRSGIITQNGAVMDGITIDSCTELHAILSDDPSDIKNSNFIQGSGHAVRCDTVGTYDWIGNTDSGYTGTRGSNATPASGSVDAMFYNNSGGLITLNVDATGQSPSVRNGAGATTVVNQTVTLAVTVVDEANNAIPYASVSIQDQADDSEISAGVANDLGVYTDSSFNYTVDVAVNVVARKSSPGDTRYLPVSAPNTITGSGLNAGIGLAVAPNAGLIPMVGVLRHGVQSEDLADASITASIDLPAGTNRKLVVAGIYWDSSADLTVSVATYDGNAMTAINNLAVNEGANWHEIAQYRYDIPDADEGIKDVVFTFSASVNIKAIAFAILDDAATGAPESNDTDSGNAVTTNPSLALNNTTADSFSVGFGITDDLDSPTATGATENRVRRSDLTRDALLNSVTILVADRATAGAHNIGAGFGANSKSWVYAGGSFAKN